eukprot:1684514-Karenia_brevis.AAC.1
MVLGGEYLKALRLKIKAVHEVMPQASCAELARMILAGKNSPKLMPRTLSKLIERTLKNDGQDGRVNNKRPRSVLTP